MGIRVAIVEDNVSFRDSLESYVNEARGFNCCLVCGLAEEALKLIPTLFPDVVLMDLNLPGMSGIACIRRLKVLCPSAQILVLTVYEDNERIFGAIKAGASGYLLKRAEPSYILQAIQEVKEGGAPMSGQIARQVIKSFQKPLIESQQIDQLSPGEERVLIQLTKGYSNKETAENLRISINTVRTHLQHIYEKLHVSSRTEAILKFLE